MADVTGTLKDEWNNPVGCKVPDRIGCRPHTLTFNWPEHVTWPSLILMRQGHILLFQGDMAGMGMCNTLTEEETHH